MKKHLFALLLILTVQVGFAQESPKHRLTLSALQHSSWTGITYSRLFHPFENKNWEWSLGAGFVSGLGESSLMLGYNSLPLFSSLTYGTRHQVGLNLGYAYRFNLKRTPISVINSSPLEYTIFTDYHALNYSLFYRYNFGEQDTYFLGIGGEFSHYLGEINGFDVNLNPAFRPFLNFGINF
ncbi:hypothetical protein [Croceimicrobium hydrocarbonivorans]|uniref:Outer membrane protein beta-barrel domain-containing protein n=1 Tax=Croceimicrobium hydrocarbonivorans TaxID=2761580 RepID=A0A7H0VD64_9FLAO|nr:hypothetical protein [Croceimicrobium hydrocarbonivorans]QNR23662.1 hypothetical protein H4K34_14965 [Croceimicrobium hydrocarbonivorans]